MALRDINRVANRWFATLNAGVNDSTTSWVLAASGATGLPTLPCLAHCEAEIVQITAVATDTPSAGLDTLTVVRGYGGTSAASHTTTPPVGLFLYAENVNDVMERLQRLERWAAARVGDQNGVIRVGVVALQVKAEGTPSMTVDVLSGAAVVSGQPTALVADTTLTFTAPTTNTRIDTVQIDQSGNIEVKAGTEDVSPSAPAVDADALKLAEIYLRVGATSIKDADDSTNGYITDSRVYI